ncbi:apoptosis regulator protein, Bcl-2 family [Opisthorchis viverrini]|uniref:Apoptosis regulator protein, Bcl-2 family n=2 Tax=Opisthorchis viverrini TaxID=6198 RepID=A0A1S8X9S1_OPIVI|nr:hypothetical protein T265_03054 [Opisthorchis viverrini]KER30580.1 hypothetical protein T265_03054 [Opisthorchis viverrini]OON23457.1 apoptosis regulator protein, Bcl-2 family [Opisthorchis viverrini]
MAATLAAGDYSPSDGDQVDNDVEVDDYQTQTIIEEFVQCKLRSKGRMLHRHSVPADMETQVLVSRLLDISNELEERYGDQLNRDAERWIKAATFEKFVQIAKGVFADGQVSLSRIVVLFMFAVKVILNAFARNLSALACDVIRFATKFIVLHGVYNWIQARGGWFAVIQACGPGTSTTGGVLAFLSVLLVVLFALKRVA